jgi:TfoX/Sxy family transcriptional regulator of competence genes
MFGGYLIYIDDKPVLLVCDNTVFVKKLDCLAAVMAGAPSGLPYPGAKEHYILDIGGAELTERAVSELLKATPVPKPRKKESSACRLR